MAPPTLPGEFEQRRIAQQRRNRKRAWQVAGILATWVILVAVGELVPGLKGTVPGHLFVWAGWLCCLGVLWFGQGRLSGPMRARLAPEVLAKDSRAPVVYLRPFAADQRILWFERVIKKWLGQLGPMVAVGRPDERLPAGVIARAYADEGQWQERVMDLIGRARLVVTQIGTSEGLMWELIMSVHLLRPDQLLVCVGDRGRAADSRYRQFRDVASSIFPRGLPDHIPGSGFITFGPDWTPIPSREIRKRSNEDSLGWLLEVLHHQLAP